MIPSELCVLKTWFADYCHSFFSPDQEDQRNISLKEHHTHNVRDNILRIAQAESLSQKQQAIAETIALFHDVGRFAQYSRYKTFKDSESVNHAALGADILIENKVLDALPKAEQDLVIKSVRLHNVFVLPKGLHADENLYLKLIRDADKLDIWQVFIDFYRLPEQERASAVGLGFPDLPCYSEDVISSLDNRCMVNLSMLKTLNDFKLLQLSWVFDLNFQVSFEILKERDYIASLAATLPKDGRVNGAIGRLRQFVDEKLAP